MSSTETKARRGMGGGHPGEKLWKYVLAMGGMGDRTIYDEQNSEHR